MFRTVYVSAGEGITVVDNWLLIKNSKGEESKIPVDDIYTLLLENVHTRISVYALQYLSRRGVNIVCCDDKYLPACNVIPFAEHYRPYGVMKKQLALTVEFKDLIWQRIVKAKIMNQHYVAAYAGIDSEVVERLRQLAEEVLPGDIGNREAIAAKMFFRNLYGCDFTRFADDVLNYAMNYGYTIIRSAVARSLVAYGYNCVLGVHHINENNAFNLADDFMEPFRPVVDQWVQAHNDELVDELSKQNKLALVNLLNVEVNWNNKIMKLHNALDKYVASFTTAIDKADVNKLLIPKLSKNG